jgi:hypothetical protein
VVPPPVVVVILAVVAVPAVVSEPVVVVPDAVVVVPEAVVVVVMLGVVVVVVLVEHGITISVPLAPTEPGAAAQVQPTGHGATRLHDTPFDRYRHVPLQPGGVVVVPG